MAPWFLALINKSTFLSTYHRVFSKNWPFALFLAFMLWQHAYVYLYHDDYGYASLSYLGAFTENVHGHSFTIAQMLGFLKSHYMTFGGRLLSFTLLLSMLRWEIWVYRIAQSIAYTLIVYLISRMVNKFHPKLKTGTLSGILACAFYGLIPVVLHQNGTYWAAASILYVWPFLWIFASVIYYDRVLQGTIKPGQLVLSSILFFACGFSQEQVAIPAFFMLAGFLAAHFYERNKGAIRLDLFSMACFLAGYTLLVLATGNFLKFNSEYYAGVNTLSLWDRGIYMYPSFIQIMYGYHIYPVIILWGLINAVYIWKQSRVPSGFRFVLKFFYILQAAYSFILFSILVCNWLGDPGICWGLSGWFSAHLEYSPWFWGLFTIIAWLTALLFSLRNRSFILLGALTGGISSQLTILILPDVNPRMGLVMVFALFPLLTALLVSIIKDAATRKLGIIITCALLIASIVNSAFILNGYRQNSPYHARNHIVLSTAARDISLGKNITSIELEKIPNELYSGVMAYMPGYDYISWWIIEYYDLPQDIELRWH